MNAGLGSLMMSIVLSQQPAHPDVLDRFDRLTCRTEDEAIPYRLYVPPAARQKPVPLVIWFHGRGEAGEDNCAQLAWLELILGCDPARREVSAIVLAVQTARQAASWDALGSAVERWDVEPAGEGDSFQRLDAVVEEVLHTHQVDRQRIYLAGISQGASACWQYARRHPDRFAALLPMATGPISERVVCELKGLPIWAFQSAADGPAQIRRMTQVFAALADGGGNGRLTIVHRATHDCWSAALQDYGAWQWLLDQRRGAASSRGELRVAGRYLRRSRAAAVGAVLGTVLGALLTTRLVSRVRRTIRP